VDTSVADQSPQTQESHVISVDNQHSTSSLFSQ
jgi:hypothetical protein